MGVISAVRQCLGGRLPLVPIAALLVAGCVSVRTAEAPATSVPSPTSLPIPVATAAPSPSASPAPTPGATPRIYRVRPGDTLSGIAGQVGRTVGQILAANPGLTDPNALEAGDRLVIPEKNAPERPVDDSVGQLVTDAIDDLVSPEGEPAIGVLYADIASLVAAREGRELVVELDLGNTPRRVDPDVETLAYSVVIDVDDDGEADHRLRHAADPGGDGRLVPSLEALATGKVRAGDAFPGSVSVIGTTVIWRVRTDALGGGSRYRLGATVERSWRPGGKRDGEIEVTVDHAPDRVWPAPEAGWFELGLPLRP